MQLSQTILRYNQQELQIPAGKMSFFDELYVDYKVEEHGNYRRFQILIHPKENITLQELRLEFHHPFEETNQVFCNGFQSSSASRLYSFQEKTDRLMRLAPKAWRLVGDQNFDNITTGKGRLHSWSYAYFTQKNEIQFIGSLTEQTGFTLIQFDQKQQQVRIQKDCAQLELRHSATMLDVLIFKGKKALAFEKYFELMEVPQIAKKNWLAWSNQKVSSQNQSEAYLLDHLKLLSERKAKVELIQIEEGYQKAIGDWLTQSSHFPNGIKALSTQIKAHSFRPAIWLAPFVCEANSNIFQQQKAWLLKDEKAQPIIAGYHPRTKAPLYALDFYREDFQKYLTGVFFTLFSKWGFELVNLDFLYAVCLRARKHKTRGQVMCEAIQFLRSLAGDRLISAQAVPLATCFAQVDFCNIAMTRHFRWENTWQKWFQYRERSTSLNALRSILSRQDLQEKAFLVTGPSVSLSAQKQLNPTQQDSIITIQALLSNLLINEDDLRQYSEEQWSEWETAAKWNTSEVHKIQQYSTDVYFIYFEQDKINYTALCNLSPKEKVVSFKSNQITLEAFESLILKA